MNKHILLLFSLVLLVVVFYRVITKTTWKFWLWEIREGMEDADMLEEPEDPTSEQNTVQASAQTQSQNQASSQASSQASQRQTASTGWGDLINAASQTVPATSTQTMEEEPTSSCMDYNDGMKLPLREYAIKASYNSAYDGTRISEDQLANVIYAGCRFVDLNVFYADDKLYVGYAADNNPTSIETSLPFSVAMSYILRYAFVVDPAKKKKPINEIVKEFEDNPGPNGPSMGVSQNYIDYPFFIHLRIYRPENSSLDIIEKVAEYMKEIVDSPYFFKDSTTKKPVLVDGNTPLCQIQRKFIVSMDVRNIVQIYAPTSTPSADRIPNKTLRTLRKFIHILTGGHTWRAYYNYSDVLSMNKNMLRISNGGVLDSADSSGKKTSVQNMYIVYPFISDKENPDSLEILKKYSIQTVPNRFYIQDGNLDKYNEFFEIARKPFVPLSECLMFISKTESSNKV